MAVIEATNENFDELIREKDSAMVDFYGDHCSACVFTAPCLRDVADDLAEIQFVKVNTSTCPELAKRFDIKGLPTFLYFYKGEQVQRNDGGMDRNMILEKISGMLYPEGK